MNVSDLHHLRDNKMVRFRFDTLKAPNGNSYVVEVVNYMVADPEFWDDPATLETRGNVYNTPSGDCVSAALPKFFNVNERHDTQEHLIKDQILEVFDKIDGSMITPVALGGNLWFKSKKSFDSKVAQMATENAPKDVVDFCKVMYSLGYTPIFEYTSPDNRVVIDYGNYPKFTLLALRHIESGEIVRNYLARSFAEDFGISIVCSRDMSWDELKDQCETAEGIEGFVLLLNDGRFVKMKTKWYLSMHYTMTDLRERDVVAAVLDNTIDDLKSLVAGQGLDIGLLEEIETRVISHLVLIQSIVETIVANEIDAGSSVKDVALDWKFNEYFKLIITKFRGCEPDYATWWSKRHLKNSSLRVIYNINF